MLFVDCLFWSRCFAMCFCHVASLQYPPLNELSCVYWYLVGCYSPQTPQSWRRGCYFVFRVNPKLLWEKFDW